MCSLGTKPGRKASVQGYTMVSTCLISYAIAVPQISGACEDRPRGRDLPRSFPLSDTTGLVFPMYSTVPALCLKGDGQKAMYGPEKPLTC